MLLPDTAIVQKPGVADRVRCIAEKKIVFRLVQRYSVIALKICL